MQLKRFGYDWEANRALKFDDYFKVFDEADRSLESGIGSVKAEVLRWSLRRNQS